MHAHQRRSGESSSRSGVFITTNTDVLGQLHTSPAGQQLADANAQIASLAAAQAAAERNLSGHSATQKRLAATLYQRHMLPIAQFARASLRGVPGYAALTRSAHGLQGTALVAAATGMAAAAQPFAAELVRAQFPDDVIDQLNAATSALSTTMTDWSNTRQARVRATAGLKEQVRRAREAVAMLDPVVTRKLADEPGLLAEWRSAKRITAAPTASVQPVASTPT